MLIGVTPSRVGTVRSDYRKPNAVVRPTFHEPVGPQLRVLGVGATADRGQHHHPRPRQRYSADSRAKNLYLDSIFRYNRVFGNLHTPLNSGSYMPAGARPTSYFREPFRLMNSRIYHNTITDNLGHGWEVNGLAITANEFANNVFAGNDWTGPNVQFTYGSDVSRDNRVRGNLFRGAEPDQPIISYRGELCTVADADARTALGASGRSSRTTATPTRPSWAPTVATSAWRRPPGPSTPGCRWRWPSERVPAAHCPSPTAARSSTASVSRMSAATGSR